jgi:hypothetical protein
MATKKAAKKMSTVKAVEVGAGVVAGIAAALAGGYLLYGKGPRHAKAKAWVMKAKKDAAREIKVMKRVGEKEYKAIVEKNMKRYGSLENVSMAEIMKAAADAKKEWSNIHAQAKKMAVAVVKKAPIKKVMKKKPASRKAKK